MGTHTSLTRADATAPPRSARRGCTAPRRRPLAVLLLLAAAACGGRAADEWPTEGVRAVVRHEAARAADRPLVVWSRIGDGAGVAMPWAVEQALVTAGFMVVDTATPGAVLLRLLAADPADGADGVWRITTEAEAAGAAPEGQRIRWQVDCRTACAVTDSSVSR